MAKLGQSNAQDSSEENWYSFWIALAGLGTVVLISLAAIIAAIVSPNFPAKDVLAAVTGVIGTLAGGYAGHQAGAAGKTSADNRAMRAENKVTRLAGAMEPDKANAVLDSMPG